MNTETQKSDIRWPSSAETTYPYSGNLDVTEENESENIISQFREWIIDYISDVIFLKIPITDAISKFKTVPKLKESPIKQDIFCDAFWFWGSQITPKTPEWTQLCQLIKELNTVQLIDLVKLKTGLELNLLADIGGIISDETRVKNMLVKQNTGKLYQQQKFNLLREETEGFSKLSIALTQLPRSGNDTEISIHVSHIFELVGQFDLDPNRAIDIILDSFELQCWNLTAFLSLLQHFQPSHIAAILGLKFSNEHVLSSSTTESGSTATNVTVAKDVQTSNTKSKDGIKDSISSTTVGLNNNSNITNEPLIQGPPTTTPASLYSLAAILLAHDLVKLDQLLPFLLPIIEDICKDLKKLEQSLRQEIKTYGVVSLTALPPAPSPSVGPTMSTSSNLAVVPSSNQVSSTNISQNTSQNTLQSSGNNGKPPPPLYPKGSTSGIASPPPPPPDKPRPPSGLPSSGTITKMLNGNTTVSNNIPEEIVDIDWDNDETLSIPPSAFFAEGNQITGLISALLGLRRWDLALSILQIFSSYNVDIIRCEAIRRSLISLISWRSDTLYDHISPRKLKLSRPSKYQKSSTYTSSNPSVNNIDPSEPLIWIEAAQLAGLDSKDGLSCVEKDRLAVQFCPGQASPCLDILTFPTDIQDMIFILNHHISHSPTLFTQICRLLKAHRDAVLLTEKLLSTVTTPLDDCVKKELFAQLSPDTLQVLEPMLNIISSILLPALASTEGNTFLAGQVWSIIVPLPFGIRFKLYDIWRGPGIGKDGLNNTSSSKSVEVAYAETKALHACKGYMKRLSKETVRMIGRQIARISHSNPLAVFNHILTQIEVFDNLIPLVVEALRYATEMSRDALAGLCLTQLQKEGLKLKPGDTHYTLWFSALARFVGMVYARFPETELRGLLYFLLGRLQAGQSLDLLVLRELLSRMGKCETLLDLSQSQLEALSGGRNLRTEMMSVQLVSPVAGGSKSTPAPSPESIKKGVRQLRDELIASLTAVPLLVCIAQVRTRTLYCTETPHLKLVSHLYDTAQDVLMQFTDFLVGSLPLTGRQMQTIVQLMPSFRSLVQGSGLSIAVAFQLVRPIVRAALIAEEDPMSTPDYLKPWYPFSDNIRNVVIDYYKNLENNNNNNNESSNNNMDIEKDSIVEDKDTMMVTQEGNVAGDDLWSLVNPDLVIAFWTLGLSDLSCPADRYQSEIRRLKDKWTELDNGPSTSVDDKTLKARRAEATRLLSSIKDLQTEFEEHKRIVEIIKKILQSKKDSFILQTEGSIGVGAIVHQTVEALLQSCVLERTLLSPSDALYSVQFFFQLQTLNTPGFSTLTFMNKFIRTVVPCLYCVTEAEAACLGYSLRELLHAVNSYLNDRNLFKVESAKVGFIVNKKQLSGTAANATTTELPSVVPLQISYAEWKLVTNHYLKHLTEILREALSGSEYMRLRASLLVLSKLSEEYPTTTSIGNMLLKRVEAVEKEQEAAGRSDLQNMAKGLATLLRRNMSNWILDETPTSAANTNAATAGKKNMKTVTTTATTVTTATSNLSSSSNTKVSLVNKKIGTGTVGGSIISTNKRKAEITSSVDNSAGTIKRSRETSTGKPPLPASTNIVTSPATTNKNTEKDGSTITKQIISTTAAAISSDKRPSTQGIAPSDASTNNKSLVKSSISSNIGGSNTITATNTSKDDKDRRKTLLGGTSPSTSASSNVPSNNSKHQELNTNRNNSTSVSNSNSNSNRLSGGNTGMKQTEKSNESKDTTINKSSSDSNDKGDKSPGGRSRSGSTSIVNTSTSHLNGPNTDKEDRLSQEQQLREKLHQEQRLREDVKRSLDRPRQNSVSGGGLVVEPSFRSEHTPRPPVTQPPTATRSLGSTSRTEGVARPSVPASKDLRDTLHLPSTSAGSGPPRPTQDSGGSYPDSRNKRPRR